MTISKAKNPEVVRLSRTHHSDNVLRPYSGKKSTEGSRLLNFLASSDISESMSSECQNDFVGTPERKTLICGSSSGPPPSVGAGRKTGLKFSEIPRSSRLILGLLCTAQAIHLAAYSVLGPFFPTEAQKKGATAKEIGLIFSTYELFVFLATPIFAAQLSTIGAPFMFSMGLSSAGVCAILFGILRYCPSGTSFIVLCFAVRLTEATAMAAYNVATFAIAASEFPNNIATVFGLLESCTSIGLMVGPLLGGLLYQVGGYGLPFFVIGGVMIFNGLLFFRFLLPIESVNTRNRPLLVREANQSHAVKPLTSLALLKCGVVWLGAVITLMVAATNCFVDANLALHLQTTNSNVASNGLLFVIRPLTYAVVGLGAGRLVDTRGVVGVLLTAGCIAEIVSNLLIGPSPLFTGTCINNGIGVMIVALVLSGSAMGTLCVSSMNCVVLGAKQLSDGDSIETYGAVAGVFNTAFALGGFLGPASGGFIVEQIGFSLSTTYIAVGFSVMLFVVLVYFCTRKRVLMLGDTKAHDELTAIIPTRRKDNGGTQVYNGQTAVLHKIKLGQAQFTPILQQK